MQYDVWSVQIVCPCRDCVVYNSFYFFGKFEPSSWNIPMSLHLGLHTTGVLSPHLWSKLDRTLCTLHRVLTVTAKDMLSLQSVCGV